MNKISGLTCMVTGGAGSLGLATVQNLIQNGAKVILCDLPKSNGEKLAMGINNKSCVFHPTDIRSEEDVKSAIELATKKFGGLNALVNCAGVSLLLRTFNPIKERVHDFSEFQKVIDVNCNGTFNAIRLACEAFALNEPDENGQRGVIVNTAAISAYDGTMGQAAYAASNGCLIGMTLPIARDLASMGVRVMTIAPGFFESELVPDSIEYRRYLKNLIPLPARAGEPEEFADMVQSVLENPMLNGETIRLDGAVRLNP